MNSLSNEKIHVSRRIASIQSEIGIGKLSWINYRDSLVLGFNIEK